MRQTFDVRSSEGLLRWRTRAICESDSRGNASVEDNVEDKENLFEETSNIAVPVTLRESRPIGNALSVVDARLKMQEELGILREQLVDYSSGIVRLEVQIDGHQSALLWLQGQQQMRQKHVSFYLSTRGKTLNETEGGVKAESGMVDCGSTSCIGTSWMWKGDPGTEISAEMFADMQTFLDPRFPNIRCFGGTRFDCAEKPAIEWEPFGSFLFFVPMIEYQDSTQHATLSCTIAWKEDIDVAKNFGVGAYTAAEAIENVLSALKEIDSTSRMMRAAPNVEKVSEDHIPNYVAWEQLIKQTTASLPDTESTFATRSNCGTDGASDSFSEFGQGGLDSLLTMASRSFENEAESGGKNGSKDGLTKVVLGRKTELKVRGDLDPFQLLHHLQRVDPSSFQFYLSLPHGGGSFLGSTPEQLFARTGHEVSTEAIAGTRRRGDKGNVKQDFFLTLELLRNPKDHVEFTIVRDWLHDALQSVCSRVKVEVQKSVIKKQAVQHLYGHLSGTLKPQKNDLDLLKALHPTPAVCGRSRQQAQALLREKEPFDRGFYSGPIGWISSNGAQFIVAIRSALIREGHQPNQRTNHALSEHLISLYAGVGIVKDSFYDHEWTELDLKISPLNSQFRFRPSPLLSAPNINIKMSDVVIEEFLRSGIYNFAIAPGSRSSPLVFSIATNPSSQTFPGIDERSLGFWSLGFSKATGVPAPIITSSGTAVGNLFPAVIESSLSSVPMIVLTADRPAELRKTGANQTIDQVKIFGDYVRLFHDISPPVDDPVKMRSLLTTVDAAIRTAKSVPAGPVHLNFQLNEPLAPTNVETQDQKCDQQKDLVLDHWWMSHHTFTEHTCHYNNSLVMMGSEESYRIPSSVERGLIVIGELNSKQDKLAVKELSKKLDLPVVVDVLSGLKQEEGKFVSMADQLLDQDSNVFEKLRPDFILQIGGHLTSKRLLKFLESCRMQNPEVEWALISPNINRDDPQHLVTHHITSTIPKFVQSLPTVPAPTSNYHHLWNSIDRAVIQTLKRKMHLFSYHDTVSEPYVAYLVSKLLPYGHGLFLGNGMPIRDMEMFSGLNRGDRTPETMAVGANRGASGIDGVVSTALGYANGLRKPTTLVIGDVSFLHDTNGLLLLRNEVWPPLVIIIINNGGGGIFDFLPIANSVQRDMFDALWSTPQHTNIANLCQAHGIAHQRVTKARDVEQALKSAWDSNQHSIVEIVTDRSKNVLLHQDLKKSAAETTQRVIRMSNPSHHNANLTIVDLRWSPFKLPLSKKVTTNDHAYQRHGIYLEVTIEGGSEMWKGVGEIAPLPGLHRETMDDIHAQLRMVYTLLMGQEVPTNVALLNGNLDAWFDDALGIGVDDLSPSLRFGLDCAILSAVAQSRQLQLHQLNKPSSSNSEPCSVPVNALLTLDEDEQSVLKKAQNLKERGFKTIKIKVGRKDIVKLEASLINKISKVLGAEVKIRLDANRAWTLGRALSFANHLHCPTLEYIEEPVSDLGDLAKFQQLTDLPVAVDESLHAINSSTQLMEFLNQYPRLAACIMKPTLFGSIDKLLSLMEVCISQKIKVVITSTFESPIGLRCLSQFAHLANMMQMPHLEETVVVSHGLGTIGWFLNPPMDWATFEQPEVFLQEIGLFSQCPDHQKWDSSPSYRSYCQSVSLPHGEYHYSLIECGYGSSGAKKPTLLFLHGFLGSKMDWLPTMQYLSHRFHCLAIDLPGHGSTLLSNESTKMFSFQSILHSLTQLLMSIGVHSCSVIGYSMGARLAALLVASPGDVHYRKLVMVSGSFGYRDKSKSKSRIMEDSQKARVLLESGDVGKFVERWYNNNCLWTPLRRRQVMFQNLIQLRVQGSRGKASQLAKMLVMVSTGRMPYLGDALSNTAVETYVLYGKLDKKLKQSLYTHARETSDLDEMHMIEIVNCGHVLQLEQPLKFLRILHSFL